LMAKMGRWVISSHFGEISCHQSTSSF
jgi:hypothetical protein